MVTRMLRLTGKRDLSSWHWSVMTKLMIMDIDKAKQILTALADDHAYPAMVIDRVLIDVQRAHGHAAVNQVIDACELQRRFGIRKVWPDPKP